MASLERGLLASVAFVAVVLALLELVRRSGVAADVTRKAFHAATGTWVLAAVALFPRPAAAAWFYLALAGFTYVSFHFALFRSIEDDGPGLGSVLLPLSAALLLVAFGEEHLEMALAGILAVAWGDSAAGLVGRRLGSRKYHVLGHARTMEGTLALFLVSSAAMAIVLGLSARLDWHQAVAFALIAGTVAASIEVVSAYGTDNLTVPWAAASTLWVLSRAMPQ